MQFRTYHSNGFSNFFKDGTAVEVVHMANGVVVREETWDRLLVVFSEVWPWIYGPGAPNSKDKRTMAHSQAYDFLISAVWPADSDQRFFALEGFPPRADFHKVRVDTCIRKFIFVEIPLFSVLIA